MLGMWGEHVSRLLDWTGCTCGSQTRRMSGPQLGSRPHAGRRRSRPIPPGTKRQHTEEPQTFSDTPKNFLKNPRERQEGTRAFLPAGSNESLDRQAVEQRLARKVLLADATI